MAQAEKESDEGQGKTTVQPRDVAMGCRMLWHRIEEASLMTDVLQGIGVIVVQLAFLAGLCRMWWLDKQ